MRKPKLPAANTAATPSIQRTRELSLVLGTSSYSLEDAAFEVVPEAGEAVAAGAAVGAGVETAEAVLEYLDSSVKIQPLSCYGIN